MTPARPSRLEPAAEIARHRHAGAYATIVLEGGYEEAGDAGRFRVGAGDVLVHAPFSAHRDVVANARTVVLDLPLPLDARDWPSRARVLDAGAIIRSAQRDRTEAAGLLLEAIDPVDEAEADLPDLLARDVSEDPSLAIACWSRAKGISRETAWRQFRSAYGVDIAGYRSEARARIAWRMIASADISFASIAATAGFSDQAHMSRAVKALTGRTPGQWRSAWRATSVQDSQAPLG